MAVNLKKGQRVNIASQSNGVRAIIVGLGWDSAKFGDAGVDCDVSAILCGADRKMRDVVYFGKPRGANDAVAYSGDSRTGEGNGENEQIYIKLAKLPSDIDRIAIAVNIYDAKAKRQHFGMINNAFVRVSNWKTGEEICQYNLTDNYSGMTGIILVEIVCRGFDWDFVTIGQGIPEASRLQSIVKMYE